LCRKPGTIYGGQSGDTACDHYHRFSQDVRLFKEIGLQAYRFSISWPRVLPDGIGRLNAPGLDFYSRLVDELLAAGLTPYVTLFHWDYPHALYQRGGWLNPDSPHWFAEYTQRVVEALSDRVEYWMTLNEPQVFIGLGHWEGSYAPGLMLPWRDVLQAAHHALLAHGLSVQAIRAASKTQPQVGAAFVGSVALPLTRSPEDVEAARQATFAVQDHTFWNNSWFADPIFFKQYPADGLRLYGKELPSIKPGDFEIIAQPLDFYGANIYRGDLVRAARGRAFERLDFPAGHPMTSFHWHITPEALYWGPKFLYERYKIPVLIAENGLSNNDWVAQDGKVHDPQRIDFTARYLSALRAACQEGVGVRGYFHWSILDNFEWVEGYRQRFGLIYVDFATQKRILKDSALWYGEVIRSNGAVLK
jgi:beta-glucosidase